VGEGGGVGKTGDGSSTAEVDRLGADPDWPDTLDDEQRAAGLVPSTRGRCEVTGKGADDGERPGAGGWARGPLIVPAIVPGAASTPRAGSPSSYHDGLAPKSTASTA
jgi:hypothetical protein